MIEPLAKRIADLGWHVQLNMESDQITGNASLRGRLPVPVVFDHLGLSENVAAVVQRGGHQ